MTPRLSVLLPLCAAVVAAIGLIRPSFATECESTEVMNYLNQHIMCDQIAYGKSCHGVDYKDYSFVTSESLEAMKSNIAKSQTDAERYYLQNLYDRAKDVDAKNLFIISMPHATNYNETIKRYDCAATLTFNKDNYVKYAVVQLLALMPQEQSTAMAIQMATLKGDTKSMMLVVNMYTKLFEQKLNQINPTWSLQYSIQETDNGTLIQYEVPNIFQQ